MSGFRFLGLGTALPTHFIQQAEAADFAGTCLAGEAESANAGTLVKALYRRSGVQTRHSVVLDSSTNNDPATQHFYTPSDQPSHRGPGTAERMRKYEQDAPHLAEAAVIQALRQAEVDPGAVTHLVTVSCSGFSAPGFDLHLIQSLNLPSTVARTHVGFMGCHGALNGLRVANAFASADPHAVVLVCAVELCTLHHQYGWDPQEIVANSLFADGAAAVVGCRADHSTADYSIANDEDTFPTLTNNFSSVIPNTESMMTWRIGDAGFRMTLSAEVPEIIKRHLPPVLDDFFLRNGLTRSDIGGWAIHPGGPRILQACREVLELTNEDLEPSSEILSRCGNMSSPTVLFILNELVERHTPLPYVMLGFGPGLNVEIALLR